jgi:transcriptional regulator with XRE-family HTH domain
MQNSRQTQSMYRIGNNTEIRRRRKALGSALRAARIRAGLTQYEAAVLVKFPGQDTVSRIEKGIRGVDFLELENLLHLYCLRFPKAGSAEEFNFSTIPAKSFVLPRVRSAYQLKQLLRRGWSVKCSDRGSYLQGPLKQRRAMSSRLL